MTTDHLDSELFQSKKVTFASHPSEENRSVEIMVASEQSAEGYSETNALD